MSVPAFLVLREKLNSQIAAGNPVKPMSAFGVNGVSENTFHTFVLLRESYGKVCSLCSHAVIIISSGDASLSFG